MFNSKKALALCATTIASFSALGTLPQAVLADTSKAGDTVITYEGTSQPAEWGLSVPATVNLNKSGNVGTEAGVYGSGKVAIVNEESKDYVDSNFDHTFNIYGSSSDSNIGEKKLYVGAGTQGEAEPTEWVGTPSNDLADDMDYFITTKADGSTPAPHFYINFGVKDSDAGAVKNGDTTTVNWTATEQNK